MKEINFRFVTFQPQDILKLTKIRSGEVKIGEKITSNWNLSSKKKYVLIGVAEDIGPQANYGLPGAKNAFEAFLPFFLNMQSNEYCKGENIECCGYIEQLTEFSTIEKAQILVQELDELLTKLINPLLQKGQIPIIIGGGHNNAYPIIRAFNNAKKKRLSVINLDPHADCRTINGRHSGNSFSTALHRQEINNYSVLGLHQAYNNEWTYNFLNHNCCFYTHFDKYMVNPQQLQTDIEKVIRLDSEENYLGIELDLDSIKNMPSSARTPSGFSIEQARMYIMRIVELKQNIAYLHLSEGAPTTPNEKHTVGKTLAYLVHDFIRNTQNVL